MRPKIPPSVWPGIPLSQVQTASAPERTTQRSSSSFRNAQNDELPSFLAQDKHTFATLKDGILDKRNQLQHPALSFAENILLLSLLPAFP